MPMLPVPARADVAVGDHIPILPFSAKGSQESTVSISATGGKRAVFARWDAFLSDPPSTTARCSVFPTHVVLGRTDVKGLGACAGNRTRKVRTTPIIVKGGESNSQNIEKPLEHGKNGLILRNHSWLRGIGDDTLACVAIGVNRKIRR